MEWNNKKKICIVIDILDLFHYFLRKLPHNFSLSLPNPLFQFFLRSTINEILQGRIIIPTLPQPLRIFTFESLSVKIDLRISGKSTSIYC